MAYESILNSLNSGTGNLITSSNAYFDFDAVTVHQHSSKLKLTDNPIENGAKITDHAVLEPKELTITGIIVGYTPPNNRVSSKINSYPSIDYALPIEVKTTTVQTENLSNRTASAYSATRSQVNRVTSDFLPTYDTIDNDLSSTDRIARGYEMLLNLQRSGDLLTFETNLKQYKNMMIVSISASQQTAIKGEFSITMREVFVVNTKMVSLLKTNLGVTQPKLVNTNRDNHSKEVTKSSTLQAISNYFGG